MEGRRRLNQMVAKLISLCLIVVGIINFLPVFGLFSNKSLESAYSITIADNNSSILMRHRALLFGLIGGFTILAAFVEKYQDAAIVIAGISMVGFIILGYSTGEYNSAISRIMLIDWIGVALLLTAVVLKYGVQKT